MKKRLLTYLSLGITSACFLGVVISVTYLTFSRTLASDGYEYYVDETDSFEYTDTVEHENYTCYKIYLEKESQQRWESQTKRTGHPVEV